MQLTFGLACITEASSQSLTPSDSPEPLHRSLYIARSHLALSPPATSAASSALQPFLSLPTPPSSAKAVAAFASYLDNSADKAAKVDEVRDLVIECEGGEGEGSEVEERVVRVIAGTMFILEGENEEAVATLTEGSAKNDLEWCVCMVTEKDVPLTTSSNALLVQLLISLNRKDLALSTYNAAKKIGNDSMLVQAMEAWIGLKTVRRVSWFSMKLSTS